LARHGEDRAPTVYNEVRVDPTDPTVLLNKGPINPKANPEKMM
jgi:hypothetical protein